MWCKAATVTYNIARKIFDIIRAMRTNAKNAVALSLAIAGAVASPLRSDAVSRKGSTPPAIIVQGKYRGNYDFFLLLRRLLVWAEFFANVIKVSSIFESLERTLSPSVVESLGFSSFMRS